MGESPTMRPSPEPQREASPSGDSPAQHQLETSHAMHHSPEHEPEASPQASTPEVADDEARLKLLLSGARDHDDIQRDIGRQADKKITEEMDAADEKRIAKANAEIKRCKDAIKKLKERLTKSLIMAESKKDDIKAEIKTLNEKLDRLENDIAACHKRINERHQILEEENTTATNKPLPNETPRAFLIRTGKITPFTQLGQQQTAQSALGSVLLDAEMEDLGEEPQEGPISHQNLMKPGFQVITSGSESPSPSPEPASPHRVKRRRTTPDGESVSSPGVSNTAESPASNDAYTSDGELSDDDYELVGKKRKPTSPKAIKSKASKPASMDETLAGIDDGNENNYRKRMRKWNKDRSEARRRARKATSANIAAESDDECFLPHPTLPDTELGEGFRIPGDIYPSLFEYQKTGVKWLYELYAQNVGGIVGDEMGLGKTIQAIAFIAGLHYSKKLTKPVIVVCPATVMKQWVNEFHTWWPALRVSILHSSGSGMLDMHREARIERGEELDDFDHELTNSLSIAGKAAKKIVDRVKRDGHVLVTTYAGLKTYEEFLLPTLWETAILDEGHKIKNPVSGDTLACKQLHTANRIILSGTPMQNNLTELWCLFDFVFPMLLGTLVKFREKFEIPIKAGGHAQASNLQVETAIECAEALKAAISPYLLQRKKLDVASDLPEKEEKVLFCKLTVQQRDAYEKFLKSDDLTAIALGQKNQLYGIDYLRKICNHPDLIDHKTRWNQPGYGAAKLSGKMDVVKKLLSLWSKAGHKTLLFAQHRITLDILEKYIKTLPGIKYVRMDGETAIKDRQGLVDQLNKEDGEINLFLATTKVGGLGVNLTGASRVIIYDPDWNPSTDIQARERCWRLGQKKKVEIYRLMSAGTIEEKMYHRQIFKQHLAQRVLENANKPRPFDMSDLTDLFSLGNDHPEGETDTSNMFRGSAIKFHEENDGTKEEELTAMRALHHTEQFTDITEQDKDARIMSAILSKSGVHSVVDNDAIVGNTRKRKADPFSVVNERKTKRQVHDAVEYLTKSAAEARRTPRAPAGEVTWTGTVGEVGRPEPLKKPGWMIDREKRLEKEREGSALPGIRRSIETTGTRGGGIPITGIRRGGGASGAVRNTLAGRPSRPNAVAPDPKTRFRTSATPASRAQSRQNTQPPSRQATPSRQASREVSPQTQEARDMVNQVRDFLLAHNGAAPTPVLWVHFGRYCGDNSERQKLFKEALKQIAKSEKTADSRLTWKLRPEYKRNRA